MACEATKVARLAFAPCSVPIRVAEPPVGALSVQLLHNGVSIDRALLAAYNRWSLDASLQAIRQGMEELAADPTFDLSQEYNLMNAPKGWMTGDFDLFPAGAGQVAALIGEIKTVKAIIDEMVS